MGDDCTIMDDTMDLTAIEIEDYPKTSIEITSLVKLTGNLGIGGEIYLNS